MSSSSTHPLTHPRISSLLLMIVRHYYPPISRSHPPFLSELRSPSGSILQRPSFLSQCNDVRDATVIRVWRRRVFCAPLMRNNYGWLLCRTIILIIISYHYRRMSILYWMRSRRHFLPSPIRCVLSSSHYCSSRSLHDTFAT